MLIPGHEGYAADVEGNIWSCRGRWGRTAWRRLRAGVSGRGYLYVQIYVSGRKINRLVSHLVLMAFAGPKPEGMEACHYPDPDPKNNRPGNLRWDTPSENQRDILRLGRKPIGSRMYNAKIAERDIAEILRLRGLGETQVAIGERFGVSPSTVRLIEKGRGWKHVPRCTSGPSGCTCGT